MRLFAAIVPPPVVVGHLAAVVAPLRARSARWSAVEAWHITVAFYGEITDRVLSDLTGRLERAASRHAPMRLRLAGVGHFGSDVMWVGVRGDITALSHLAMSAATAGRQMGIEQGYRRFRPHVTLARGTSPADRHQYVHLLATYRGPDWTAEKITLLESHLTPNQAREPKYESVGHFALTKD